MTVLLICRYIREDEDKSSCIKRAVGNVTADTEITFEYGIRTRNRGHTDNTAGECVCVRACVHAPLCLLMYLLNLITVCSKSFTSYVLLYYVRPTTVLFSSSALGFKSVITDYLSVVVSTSV